MQSQTMSPELDYRDLLADHLLSATLVSNGVVKNFNF